MAKGRRASERRREREGDEPSSEGTKTRQRASTNPNIDAPVDPDKHTAAFHPEMNVDALADDAIGTGLSGSVPSDEPGEVTQVGSRAPRPPVGGKLMIVSGEDSGAEVPLEVTPSVVGRGPNPAIQLSDPHISRAHFEMRFNKRGGGWSIADLGSTTGTLKNGELLGHTPNPIQHGDEICAGNTVLRFLWHDQVPGRRKPGRTGRPARVEIETVEEERDRSRIVLVALIVLTLLLVGGGLGGLFSWRAQQQQEKQAAMAAGQLMTEAKQLLANRDPAGALARVEAALKLVDDLEGGRPLKREARTALDAKEALDAAKQLIDDGELEQAQAQLRKIPDSSRFAPERDALRKAAKAAAKKISLRSIRSATAGGEMDLAADLLEVHLTRWPGDDDALELKLRLMEVRNARPPQNPAVRRARAAFAKGKLSQARVIVSGEAERGQRAAQRYLADLETYESALDNGRGRLKLKDGPGAKRALDRAWTLADRLGGGAGQSSLARELTDALYLAAIAAKQSGQSCDWGRDIMRASILSPKNRGVREQRRLVDRTADSGLLKARALRGEDPARARRVAAEHLCYARPGSTTYEALKALR